MKTTTIGLAIFIALALLPACENGVVVTVVNQTPHTLDTYMRWPRVGPYETASRMTHGIPKNEDTFVYKIRAFVPRDISPSRPLIFCQDITERAFRDANWTVVYTENVPAGTSLNSPIDPCPQS